MRGVARVAAEERIAVDDGTYARREGEAIELRDAGGRLLVRYENGHAEICAPGGDLRLAAPHGRVIIEAGSDLCMEAARALVLHAGPTEVRLEPDRVHVRSESATALAERIEVATRHLTTSAARVITEAEHWEVIADRSVQKSRDALREVAGLAEERLGRVRALVRGAFLLASRRTTMRSTEETSIDGKRVLLG